MILIVLFCYLITGLGVVNYDKLHHPINRPRYLSSSTSILYQLVKALLWPMFVFKHANQYKEGYKAAAFVLFVAHIALALLIHTGMGAITDNVYLVFILPIVIVFIGRNAGLEAVFPKLEH